MHRTDPRPIVRIHAVTSAELKREGPGLAIRYGVHSSPFGDCLVAVAVGAVCAITFLSDRRTERDAVEELLKTWGEAKLVRDPRATKAVAERIFDAEGHKGAPAQDVVVRGTGFQVKVWRALLRIPAGRVASYEDVAARIGASKAARAVGNAVGRNPVAFLVPCHRVLRKSGAIGGYGGGVPRKKAMLVWESERFPGK